MEQLPGGFVIMPEEQRKKTVDRMMLQTGRQVIEPAMIHAIREGDGFNDGDSEKVCIILASIPHRQFYDRPYDSSRTTPPNCQAYASFNGVGNPGGKCFNCPHDKFGSAALFGGGKRAKACRERIYLFTLVSNEAIPCIITIPPTSLQNFRAFYDLWERRGQLLPAFITKITSVNGTLLFKNMGAHKENIQEWIEYAEKGIEQHKERILEFSKEDKEDNGEDNKEGKKKTFW